MNLAGFSATDRLVGPNGAFLRATGNGFNLDNGAAVVGPPSLIFNGHPGGAVITSATGGDLDSKHAAGWPVIAKISNGGASDGRLVCLYQVGATLGYPDTTQVVGCRISDDNGITWSNGGVSGVAYPLSGSSDSHMENVFGIGNDASGNILAWVRRFGSTDGTIVNILIKSVDGITWTVPAFTVNGSSTFPAASNPVLVMPIITATFSGVTTLLCGWHADAADTGATDTRWGVLTTTAADAGAGAAWTLTIIAQGVATDWSTAPVEVVYCQLPDGRILGIGRNERQSGSNVALWQIQLAAGADPTVGANWSLAVTNITDGFHTPVAMILHYPNIDLIYTNRNATAGTYTKAGGLVLRTSARVEDIWSAPTAWKNYATGASPAPAFQGETVAYANPVQNGYPQAVQTKTAGLWVVAFHSSEGSWGDIVALRLVTEATIAAFQTERGPHRAPVSNLVIPLARIPVTGHGNLGEVATDDGAGLTNLYIPRLSSVGSLQLIATYSSGLGTLLSGILFPWQDYIAHGKLVYRTMVRAQASATGKTLYAGLAYFGNGAGWANFTSQGSPATPGQQLDPAGIVSTTVFGQVVMLDSGWVPFPTDIGNFSVTGNTGNGGAATARSGLNLRAGDTGGASGTPGLIEGQGCIWIGLQI